MELLVLFFYATMLFSAISILPSESLTNERDRRALLAFRDEIKDDPLGALSSWNNTVDFCRWKGITCSSDRQTVKVLSLSSQRLAGSLSPYLGNLTSLQELDLGDNSLQGEIPPQLGNLVSLKILNLSVNSFGGVIPANLSSCKELQYIDLNNNQLVEGIPTELTSLKKLVVLSLKINNLSGRIPPSIGNLSSLYLLFMGRNGLQGNIPDTIGMLTGLDSLLIAENQLSGMIPSSLYNLSYLTTIAIATNLLEGSLPSNMGFTLPKLQNFYVGGNMLTGQIPSSISNASDLIEFDVAYNNFTGSVPTDFGNLASVEWLNFEGNQLGTGNANDLDFITTLFNCTNLYLLDIYNNQFGGVLPNAIANLSSQLSMLIIGRNQIYGRIPEGIDQLVGLAVLRMEINLLTGSIPASIGRLHNLQVLSISTNKLSGRIPTSLSNLTQLNELLLMDNAIEGSIPPSLEKCKNLQHLDLSQNRLSGAMPAEVIGISSISISLILARNFFTGSLPADVSNLKGLGKLDISYNKLSGEIPQTLGDCESMVDLQVQGNMFQGSIPSTLSKLRGIQHLDLSHNNFSGKIPEYLGSFQALQYLNLSYNDFEGIVPNEGVFKNASAISILGNHKLCGDAPIGQLPSCPIDKSNKKSKMTGIIIAIVCVVSALVLISCLIGTVCCLRKSTKRNPPVVSSLEEPYQMVSYNELLRATEGFSSANLIGEGSFGTVYKGSLDNSRGLVAVKVINLHHSGASKSFMSECEALKNIRHRNLIKIFTACLSVDSTGNDFKALVYEYMPSGNLDEWLHPDLEDQQQQRKVLDIFQRLNISIDIAAALDYLHHQCEQPIVHCDLKPSNVLLDEDMTAHVSDFGLAKILLDKMDYESQTTSIGIRGSIGYVPPEYGLGGEVSTLGDVYSYGILLLEMFTGKRPTAGTFGEGLSLRDYASKALPSQVMEITDPLLLLLGERAMHTERNQMDMSTSVRECLVSVISLGISCSAATPRERKEMREVVVEMHAIRLKLIGRDKTPAQTGI